MYTKVDQTTMTPGQSSPSTQTIRFSAALLKEIRRRGIRRVFGVPGRENAAILFNEVDGVEYVTSRVEFNAGIAADFAGRLTRKAQVCFSTMGPGATNMTTAIASAMLNHSPLIFISAQLEDNDCLYNLTHQCVDQTSILAPITKWSYELQTPQDIIWALDYAFRVSLTEPVGPVHIAIPTNFFSQDIVITHDIDQPLEQSIRLPDYEISHTSIAAAHHLLAGSKSPLCLIGEGAIRVGQHKSILAFCREWHIPFVTAANAKGIAEFDDSLNYGAASPYMEGILGFPALELIYSSVDVLLCVGYQYVDDLLPKMWTHGRSKSIVSIASTPLFEAHSKINPDVECVGDIGLTLKALSERGINIKEERRLETLKQTYRDLVADQKDIAGTLTPIQIVDVINTHIGDGILCTDIGYYRHHAILFATPPDVGHFFTDAGLSTFGSGLPSAIAAQLEYPEKKVFLMCGDGGFHSGSGDIETLVRYKLPVIIVVGNNNAFELIGLYQRRNNAAHNSKILTFGKVDFARLAEANGCRGCSVYTRSELEEAIKAHDRQGPLLIEVAMEYRDREKFRESF